MAYAFGRGMDPRKKDGVRAHPIAFAAGLFLHASVAGALLCLFIASLDLNVPAPARFALLSLESGGVLAGLFLLARRLREPVLQAISVPDDYASNLLVAAFAGAAAASLLTPRADVPFFVIAAALAVYAPFGKIRHCVLFFITRARFGAFIGTRGVLIRRSNG